MARYGRAFPAPQRRVGPNYRGVAQTVDLPTFGLTWSFPALQVISPSVTIPLSSFGLTWDFPSLSIPIGLPTFGLSWEWPQFQAVVPPKPGDALTGDPGQVEWNGYLWGTGTQYTVQQIDGWRSLPQINNSNVERPNRHGAWDARKLAQQRIVTIRLRLNSATDPTEVDSLLDEFDQATGIPENALPLPLVIKGFGEPQLAFGHIIDKDVPMDGDWSVGQPSVGLQIACGDPRRYSLLRHGVNIPLNTPTQVGNTGNTASHPLLRIQGPATDPVLTNSTLGRVLAFDITLSGSDRLDIDTDAGSVTVGTVNKMSTLTGSSVPVQEFVLGAGSSEITYTAAEDGDAGLDVLWRDASI